MNMLGRICTHLVLYVIGAFIGFMLFRNDPGKVYSVGVLAGILIHLIVWSK